MNTFETVINKYNSLRFNSIAESLEMLVAQAEDNETSYLQFADMLVSHELSKRDKNRFNLNMKRAGFPVKKQIEEFDFASQTTITKNRSIGCLIFLISTTVKISFLSGLPVSAKLIWPSVSVTNRFMPDTRFCLLQLLN